MNDSKVKELVNSFNINKYSNIYFIKFTLDNGEVLKPFNTIFSIAETKHSEILLASETGFYIYDYRTNSFKRFFNKVLYRITFASR